MNFDIYAILVSLVFSGVGFVYFSFGRRTVNFPVMFTGLVLMGYSYFTPTAAWSLAVGLTLSALPFVLKWW